MLREIRVYELPSGRRPVEAYIEALKDGRARAKLYNMLELLAEMPYPPASVLKKMKGHGDLWEVRFKRHRLLGFKDGGTLILVHGFWKQSQKTPTQEIEVAKKRRDEYLATR